MTVTVKRVGKKFIAILLSFTIMIGTISDLNLSVRAEEIDAYGWEMLESLDPNSGEYTQLKDILTNSEAASLYSDTTVHGNYMSNDYIDLYVAGNGRFTIGTTEGNPNTPNDNNKIMLYGHPGGSTSYTTVRVDGMSYIYGVSGTDFSDENASNTSSNVFGGIDVEQKLSIIENSATGRDDVVEIKYTITNNTNENKNAGLRIMLDTMLGNNDAAPFRVPQYGGITTETEFVGDNIPQFWQAFDHLTNPSVISQGRFYRTQEDKPDKVQFTNWRRVYNNSWGYDVTPSYGNGDSAVSVIWNEKAIAPNETREYVTYYGLSEFTEDMSLPLALSVYSDNSVDIINNQYAPNPVDVTAYVQNLSSITANSVKIEIDLPDGLELATGKSVIDIGELSPNQLTQSAWSVNIKPTPVDKDYQYNVILTADDDYRKVVSRTIHVPALKQEQVLDYTIFSGSNTADLNLYGWKSNFTGNVYTGRNFNYGGSEFYVDGRIDAVGTITTNGWKTEITERCENVEKVDMPDFDASIHEMAAPFETFEQSPTYVQDKNIIDSSIKVNGDVVISGTTFEGDCYIIAEGNITYNVQSFNSTGRVLLYSRNGNITINGSQINVNGAMYAPRGNITFNTYDTTVTGFIYADSINFNGSIFNISGTNFDMVQPAPKGIVKTYTTDSDFNEGTLNGVSLAVPDQLVLADKDSEEDRSAEKVYGDSETGKGIKITYNSDKSMIAPDDEFVEIKYDLSGFGEADVDANAVDLILVVDESGSMGGSRYYNTKVAAKEIISQMKAEDRCAVIGFTEYASIKQTLTSDKTLLSSAVDRLSAYGGTCIYRGIDSASAMFDSMSSDERQKFIILLSDGEDLSADLSLAAAKRAGEQGVRIFALMIGSGTLQMQNIAINSNGIYKNAPTSDEIGKIMSYFASEVFNVAGRNTTFKTTIKNGESVDISAISPKPASVAKNEDGSVSLEWSFDRISIDENESISIPININDVNGFADITENTSCVYYDRDGKPHVIYLDDVSIPESKYIENGTWSVVFDSERDNTAWSRIFWNGVRHGDGSVSVSASVSDDGEEFGEPVSVKNYGEISELSGRYIKLDVDMSLSSDGRTPELYDITIMSEDADDPEYDNSTPAVSISSKDTVNVNRPVTLRAVVSDDLKGGEVSVKWSSENASVTFENDESLITSATVSEVGSCEIICTVSDGDKLVQAVSVINVTQPEQYDDIDPDVETEVLPKISVDLPAYADRNQKINAKINNLNNTEISWYSVIFRGNQPINVADDGSFTLTMPNSNGTYHVIVRAFDWAGNSDVKEFDIIVNNDVPSIEIATSAEKVNVGESASFAVTTSVTSKIASVKYTLNGEEVSLNEDGIYLLDTLNAGEYELRAEAVTVSGKTISASAIITVEFADVIAPTFSYRISWNGDSPFVNQPILTEVVAEDDSGTVYVEVSVNGEVISGVNNSFEFIPETAGEYTIFIKAYDDAGNTTTFERKLSVSDHIDTTPPTGTLTFNKTAAYVGEEITARIEASDDSGEVIVTAALNDVPVEVVDNLICFTPDETGEYNVAVTLADAAGNKAVLSQKVTITTLDTTPPALTVNGIPGKITIGQSIEIIAEAADESGDVHLSITANGSELEISEGKASFAPDRIGEHKIVVTATDAAGNSVVHEYTVDCVEEELNEDVYPPTGSVTFNTTHASVGDEVIAIIEAEDDSGEVFIKAAVNGNEIEVIDNKITFIPDKVGTYSFVITVSDAAGNAAALTQDVTVAAADTTAPVLTVNGIPESAELNQKVEFSVEAADNSGEVLVTVTVNNTPVDVVDGKAAFVPDTIGEYVVTVTASDKSGNSVTKEYKVTVSDNSHGTEDNTPPMGEIRFDSETVLVGNKITAVISASDDSGEVNISAEVNGLSVDVVDNIIEFTPDKAGIYTFTVVLSDPSGNTATLTKSISAFEPSGDTTAPELEIISFPAQAYVGEEAKLEFRATDDSGEVFVTVTVNGKEIPVKDGKAVFTPEAAGAYNVVISAYDAAGNNIAARGTITADDTTLPTMSITGLTHYMTLGETIIIGITASDDSGIVNTTATINGKSVDIVNGKIEFTPDETGIYKFIIRTEDPSENFVQKEYDILVTEPLVYDDGKPAVTIYANDGSDTANIGETITFQVSASDPDGIESVSVTVNGKEIELDPDGKASFTPDEIGRYDITVKAKDELGNEISESLKIKVVDPADRSACTVAISSPADGAVVTSPVEVTGTVSGEGLVYYALEYCPADGTEYTEFASGNTAVNNGVLGIFDPTLLENGYYNIRLTARSSNYSVSDEIVVSVEGQMKIGNYSIAFQDMDIPVAGYPLTVIRSYDSRRKSKSGDFGYGWDMTLSSIKLSESCEPGLYWSQEAAQSGFVKKYYFAEDRTHEITIDYGNGKTDKFKMKLSPDQRNLYPIEYDISVSYEPQGNTKSKLEAIATTTDLIFTGNKLCDSNTIRVYNPSKYKLTRPDGTVYIISDDNGVESITDTNGNVITFTENEVKHSDGKSIVFERDSENRVTKITDPYGKTVQYTYSSNGDLSAVTDEAGETTTFKYDRNHYLTDIIDSRGIKVARNEYDDNGRLIATIDANGNRLEFSHDVDGRQDVVTDRLGHSTVYIYDNRGNVISETDALGNTTKSTYDSYGNLKTKTDALGNVTTYNYDAQGNLLSVTNALGETVNNTYTEKGQLKTITSMGVTQFVVDYDDFGNLTTTTDAEGNKTQYEYDGGKVTSITDGIGSYMQMSYDSEGRVISSVNGNGETVTFTYDSEGNCASKTITRTTASGVERLTEKYVYDVYGNGTQIIYADGSVTNTEYDSVGNMTAAVDSKGRRTTYDYDLYGNLIKITYCDNTTETFEYDAENRNIKATDRLGRTVEMTYDAVGNLLKKTYPNGSEVSYVYDAKYRLVSTREANGGTTKYEYDALDRNTAIIDALGNRTEFGYSTSNGQLETMTDPKGNTYTYGYDRNGNRTSVTMPDGTTVTTAYDARGRIVSQTDQHGYTTKYTYDGADRLTSVTDALGSTWRYAYNSVGELVSITDANGNTTRYEYDRCGRVIKTTNAKGSTATVTYDEAGNVLTSTDYAGNTTSYVYDDLDRVVSKTVAGDSVFYTYTDDGMLSSVSDKNGTISYTYDIMSGLKSVTTYDGSNIEYSYDKASRLTAVKTPFGTTKYEYDLMDRVVRVVAHDGTATLYEYDDNGNRTAVRYANGIVASYEYDEVNRLVREKVLDKNGAPVVEYSYTLGAAGERLKVVETDRTVEYEYDELYRLVKETVTDSNGTIVTEYTYDRNSNRLTKTVDGVVTEYAYNELNQLVSETGITYEYDLNGNLVKKTEGEQTTTYTYNAQNRLIRVTVQSGQQVNVEEYRYDYAGNRIAKIGELSTNYYLVDTNGALSQVLAEYDENGSLTTYYTRGEELISQERNGTKSYYLYDGFDSVRMLTDDEGIVTDTYTFDAFGNLTDSTGDTENSYLYRGEQFDSFTGLYYLRARYMNPSTGTFITMDEYAGSVFEPVSLHKYLYANANPVMNSDPTGYFTLGELNVSQAIENTLHNMLTPSFSMVMKWINFFASLCDTANQIGEMLHNGASLAGIADAMLRGAMSGFLLNNMCLIKGIGPFIGVALAAYGYYAQFDAFNQAVKDGDYLTATFIGLQLLTSATAIGDSCFTGDTLVAVDNGQKRIDEIEVGDKVWAYNVETGEIELKTVTKVYVHSVDEILHLYTDEGDIDTTANHPFYVIGKGWVAAGDLAIGDEVYNLDGTTSTVLGFEIEVLDEPVLVYNLEVEDLHSYFVGCVPVLVHNYQKGEPLNDNDYVVRGGVSAPETLINNQKKELLEFGGTSNRGSISANGGIEGLETLAGHGNTGDGFPNPKIGYTKAGDIRHLGNGWQVIHDPTIGDDGTTVINPYHTAIIPPNGARLTPEQASSLSQLFKITDNTFKK